MSHVKNLVTFLVSSSCELTLNMKTPKAFTISLKFMSFSFASVFYLKSPNILNNNYNARLNRYFGMVYSFLIKRNL